MKQVQRPNNFIYLSNKAFKLISDNLDGNNLPDVFVLYFILLTLMNWENKVYTTIRILANLLQRNKRYDEHIYNRLLILQNSGLISFNSERYSNKNSMLIIEISNVSIPYTQIKAENERLLKLTSANGSKTKISIELKNNALTVYCYLKTQLPYDKTILKSITQEKVADELGISKKTVNKAINFLLEVGMIRISNYGFDKNKGKMKCNYYSLYDLSKPFDNSKFLKMKEKLNKGKKNNNNLRNPSELIKLDNNSDYKVIKALAEDDILRNINLILKNPTDNCPCLLIGEYSSAIKDKDTEDVLSEYGTSYYIKERDDIDDLIERYDGISFFERSIIADITYLNTNLQHYLLKFIEDTEIPIILTSDYDKVIPALISRMKNVLRLPLNYAKDIRNHPVHKCLNMVNRKHNNGDFGKIAEQNFIAKNSPKLYRLKYMDTSTTYNDIMIDNLISKLTNGKTYHEV